MLFRRFTLHMLLPGGVLAVGGLWLLRFWARPPEVDAFLPHVPALVLFAGLLLGCRFNRTRLVFVLLLLAVADLCLHVAPTMPAVRQAVALFFPVNLLLISCYAERGLITPLGCTRLAAIGLQPFLLLLLVKIYPQTLTVLSTPLFVWSRPLFPALPHSALAATALVALLLLLRVLRRPAALETGFFWVLVCVAVPLLFGVKDFELRLWFTVAGVIMCAAVIEMSHNIAFRDELTGLPARRALNEELLKTGRCYAIAMVDIDHFKKVNDTYGHDVGDQVLRMVAARLQQVTGGGRAFRYGGEEFTILFPGRTVKEVLPHLEELRKAVGAAGFTLRDPSRPRKKPAVPRKGGNRRLSVTVSIGAAERCDGSSAEAVLKSADQALYKAKQTGRNRVCVAMTTG